MSKYGKNWEKSAHLYFRVVIPELGKIPTRVDLLMVTDLEDNKQPVVMISKGRFVIPKYARNAISDRCGDPVKICAKKGDEEYWFPMNKDDIESKNWRITIPNNIRKVLKLNVGSEFDISFI